MGKRKNNPLSDARKSNQNDKADRKAKELWHRKSGAGFYLFVDYYSNQSKNVVYTAEIDDDMNARCMAGMKNSTDPNSIKVQGKGMSRAAKRRKKKKYSVVTAASNKNDDSISTINTTPVSISENFYVALKDIVESKNIIRLIRSLSDPLPLTFRIRLTKMQSKDAEDFIQELETKFSHLVQPVFGSSSGIFQGISGLTKASLGKMSPELKSLVVKASETGLIARQEIGSMLPVIALHGTGKLKRGSKLLDMCASPGSKTLQALEIVGGKGRVVANEIHELRLETLKAAVGRSGVSHQDSIIYTNYDASEFPLQTQFECIIADVPCSGDGTIRKDSHILPNWVPSISNSLHDLQLKILKRSINLLKVGGVVSYSTCSLNPIENEAVVAAAFEWANRKFGEGSIEVITWPKDTLSELIRRPGVSHWRVTDCSLQSSNMVAVPATAAESSEENGSQQDNTDYHGISRIQWRENFEESQKTKDGSICETMWPPKMSIPGLDLSKTSRLIPHDNNTGGFFVALLTKKKDCGKKL